MQFDPDFIASRQFWQGNSDQLRLWSRCCEGLVLPVATIHTNTNIHGLASWSPKATSLHDQSSACVCRRFHPHQKACILADGPYSEGFIC
ncbi:MULTISPECIES: hypothetical protein [Xanthomonas]|uniref:hypothetical protein n=1 Tax=Xanthomonas TaxID=338 RepID=UPI0011AF0EAC|nr:MULTISPECIES: hypothetical protein [Xanthomonas]CAE1138922.1 hypothetical protein XTG_003425 [Xanthomonas euroxanthea]CAG2095056.1 hypothetical protein XCY_003347 [Xanthomonas euroxanthea]